MSTLEAHTGDWTIQDSRARGCKRWSVYGSQVIDMTVAEMDFSIAPPVLDAVRRSVERQAFGYPLPTELTGLPEVASTWLARRGLEVPPGQIEITADVMKGVSLAIKYLTRPGSAVAVLTPTYGSFFGAVEGAGRECLEVPLRLDAVAGYQLDLEAVGRAFAAGAGTILLCNPSNPTGHAFTREELRNLSGLAAEYGARVVSDEVHAPLVYEGNHVPFASVSGAARSQAITVTSASKAWNIPGLRCSILAFTNPADCEPWDRIPGSARGGISPLGINATIAAFESGEPWLSNVLSVLRENRDFLVTYLNTELGAPVVFKPEATYLAWIDLRAFDVAAAHQFLLSEAEVAVTDGPEHGSSGSGFVRLNFASPRSVVEEGLERIVGVLGKIRR